MNSIKMKVFLASLAIGALVTSGNIISSGFTAENIREWLINGLFVTAIVGFIGTKFFSDDQPTKRK
ncbi:MAG: hypothetical protein H6R01_1837 [Burkholderiaceae bacterium]|nr:hypothetical protein [Burkholderiaceae bacterium]